MIRAPAVAARSTSIVASQSRPRCPISVHRPGGARAAIDGYAGDMLHFIAKRYGIDAIQQRWSEFAMGKRDLKLKPTDPRGAAAGIAWLDDGKAETEAELLQ